MRSVLGRGLAVAGLVLCGPATAQLANCTEDFDGSCPNSSPQCGATFASSLPGDTCIFAGLPNCYSSGLRAYRVSPGQFVTITLSGDLFALRVFFAQSGGGAGVMEFLDASNEPVGTPMTPNGSCGGASMPPLQLRCFPTAVRTVVVTHTGASGALWIDDFEVNPFPAAAAVRNGSGINDLCYDAAAPILGTTWQPVVDTTGHPGATLTVLVLHPLPATGPVLKGGEVLVGGMKLAQSSKAPVGGSAVHTIPVPDDPTLAGFQGFTQGVILGGGWEACNAIDITLGCF